VLEHAGANRRAGTYFFLKDSICRRAYVLYAIQSTKTEQLAVPVGPILDLRTVVDLAALISHTVAISHRHIYQLQ
jgi:hypothetical protein